MALITVITAVKNAADLLPDTIASIQRQTMTDWRYVVVDDGSEDDTASVVERFAAADARIELIRLTESVGPYAAANAAARAVASKYIARIDGDDVAPPERFEIQLATLAASPGARACSGAARFLTPTGLEPRIRRVPSQHNGVIKWMLWFRNPLVHSTLMIETACFEELGGYGPERVGEDFRTWAALVRTNTLAISDALLVHYRRWPGQITAATDARDQPARARIWVDHMHHCAPGYWTLEDARDMRNIGEAALFPPDRALDLLRRFETAWRADPALTHEQRRELARHTAKRRLRHLRHALADSPTQVTFASARSAAAVVRSFATVITNRGPAWP
ncbi:MAG TPA: glycosyltransferase family A protein [Acidimicrobiales bacterium]|nr:glycosyltransferase family A protein [Acidimicrobiales bacterium]